MDQSDFESLLLAELGLSHAQAPIELAPLRQPEPGELLLMLDVLEARVSVLEEWLRRDE